MHNKSEEAIELNSSVNNCLLSLAQSIYNIYPHFDSNCLFTLISTVHKKYNIERLIQQLETDFIRTNVYKLDTLTDVVNFLMEETENHQSFQQELYLFINTIKEINNTLKQAKSTQMLKNSEAQFNINTNSNQKLYQNIINIVINKALDYVNTCQQNKLNDTGTQQTFDVMIDNSTYSLSPTQGIAFLNKNPYHFFIEKILGIKAINNWEENVSTRLYGIIIHDIMHLFAIACRKIDQYNIDKQIFLNIATKKLSEYKLDNDILLHGKLNIVSNIATEIEQKAKQQNLEVLCEKQISHTFNQVKIIAKADRIEINHQNKEIYIYDYKTGIPPTQKQELDGEKVQLAIIAILMLEQQQYRNYHIKGMYYICLSGKDKDRKTSSIEPNIIPYIKTFLIEIIDYFFTNGKPNYSKFIEIKPNSFEFNQTEFLIKHLSRIVKFV